MEYGSSWFAGALERDADRTAFSVGGESITWAELLEHSAAIDTGAESEVIGIDMPPSIDWLVAVFGSWLGRSSVLPVDRRLDGDALAARLKRCDRVLDRLPDPGAARKDRGVDQMSPAVILYTSGSTGDGNEVMLSHGNLIAQAVASREALEGGRSDRWLSSLPLSHTGGFAVPVRCAVWGCEGVLEPRFDARRFADLLMDPDQAITLVSLVPTMLVRLLETGLSDPPSLRRAVVSGAPLSDDLKRRAIDHGIPVVESWGMTETTGMAAVERQPGQGGAGPPLPGVHIEVAESGEVRVGGPTVAPGAMVGGMLDTGDAGRIDGGCLHVEGRIAALIVTGGEKVVPERVEAVISQLRGVRDCIVFGEPDPEWGEVVVARVAAEGVEVEELHEHCGSRLAAWEAPKRFELVEAIARTDLGKPKRDIKGDHR